MATATELNHPAKAAEFFQNKLAFTTGPVEVNDKIEEGGSLSIIDVRDAEDFAKGHLPGAVNLPEDQWDNLEVLRTDLVNILYCYSQTCHLGARAAVQFSQRGYPVMEMDGGFEAWKQNKLPVEK